MENGHVITCCLKIWEVSSSLAKKLGDAESVKIVWKPKHFNRLPGETKRCEVVDALDEDDDVQNVFAMRIFR